jgi:hypothetical protein
MKIAFAVAGLSVTLLATGCFEQAGGARSYKGPLFRYQFAGRAHLPAGTNAARFREIDALPATAELRAALAQKLAGAALPFWRKELPAGATDQSALLRPLFDDFLVAEAFVEIRGAAGNTDTVLAIELGDDRAQLWSNNLKQLATVWKLGGPRDITAEGFKGWEVKRTQAPNTLQFFRAGKWVVLGLGHEQLKQLPSLLAEAKKSGRPVPALKNEFLDLAADLPGLRSWFPIFAKWALPPVVATVSGRGEAVRTEVRLQYSGRIPWRPEPWKIPTNVVSEPLTSFTIAQGIAPWLGQIKGISDLGLASLPSQFCAWGINHEQCRAYFAAPVSDATNAMQRLAPRLPGFVKSKLTNAQGEFVYVTNKAEVVWSGLPWLIPIIQAETSGKDQYLMGGLFPLPPKHVPPPEELFGQFRGRTNLLYYDWEITEPRLIHAKQLYQLASIFDSRRTLSTNSPSQRWLSAIGPKLGNTATEITQTGPQELVLVRRSHLGFTGFELATFSIWLESSVFPFGFELPPPLPHLRTNAVPGAAPPAGVKSNSGSPAKKR